jgi:hypothetical protein
MAVFRNIEHMFGDVEFSKTGKDIKDKSEAKIKLLSAKIEERKERIKKTRKDYDITDADLVELYRAKQANHGASMYTISSVLKPCSNAVVNRTGNNLGEEKTEKIIPAGVISNIDTEHIAIQTEQDQRERLNLLSRNIDVNTSHKMNFEELQYLEF